MSLAFYIAAAVMLLFGVGVIVNKNPVTSAMCLVGSFVGLAALFITLNAYFIGVVQILVYAGAVMVLFLFIIMLLDIKAEKKRDLNYVAFAGGLVVVVAFVIQLASVVGKFAPGTARMPELASDAGQDVKNVGFALFTDYNFHLQIIGVLLLVATIGVVILSRKQSD